jgi:hypothetical protein
MKRTLVLLAVAVTAFGLCCTARADIETAFDEAVQELMDYYLTNQGTIHHYQSAGGAGVWGEIAPLEGAVGIAAMQHKEAAPDAAFPTTYASASHADTGVSYAGTAEGGCAADGTLIASAVVTAAPPGPKGYSEVASGDSYSWSEVWNQDFMTPSREAELLAQYNDLLASDMGQFWTDQDFQVNGAAGAAVQGGHYILEGPAAATTQVMITLTVDGTLLADSTNPLNPLSVAAAGVAAGIAIGNDTYEAKEYGAAYLYDHGDTSILTPEEQAELPASFDVDGFFVAGDFTPVAGGYTQSSVFNIIMDAPVNDTFMIGVGLVTGAIAGRSSTQLTSPTASSLYGSTAIFTITPLDPQYTLTPVPEPSTFALLAFGVGSVIAYRRKRK